MTYDQWEATVPATLKSDALWRVQAFRLASYLAAVASLDADGIAEAPWLVKSAGQLSSAAESIPANVAEGYARLSPKDRIRYYETPVFRYSMDYSLSLGWRRALLETGDRVTA